jgi:hypothetical protein
MKRSLEIYRDILTGAIENGGHGWFSVDEYEWEDTDDPHAVIVPDDADDATPLRVDSKVIARGVGVIRDAIVNPDAVDDHTTYLVNDRTGQRLYMSQVQRARIMRAMRAYDDHGSDLDVIDYLAIVECGLFGAVTYA